MDGSTMNEVSRLKGELHSLREELRQVRELEKACRKELEFKNLVLDTIQAVVIVMDAKGGNALRYANNYFIELSGYSVQEMKALPGLFQSPTLSDEEKKRYADFMRRMAAGERPLSWENWYITKDNKQRRAIYTSTILDDEGGDAEYIIASGIDITELHETREQLRLAKEEAENATRLKDQFVSLASHDLRSPLASLMQMLKMAESNGDFLTAAETAKMSKAAIAQCESMMSLINRLLNLGRIRSGKITLSRETVGVKELVGDVYRSMSHLSEKKDLSFSNQISGTLYLKLDRDLFAEVIRNLLSNAIKFSRAGGSISVYEPKGVAHLAVRDFGIGIPRSMLPHLFTGETKTVRSGTEGEGGTGFGLPFCREIMELHGGSISAEADEGKGSVFFLHLPAD